MSWKITPNGAVQNTGSTSHIQIDDVYWGGEHRGGKCSGQLIPDSKLSFSSVTAGANPPLAVCGLCQL